MICNESKYNYLPLTVVVGISIYICWLGEANIAACDRLDAWYLFCCLGMALSRRKLINDIVFRVTPYCGRLATRSLKTSVMGEMSP